MIALVLVLALQDAAPKSANGAYFECVRVTAARLAESREAADVIAEGAIHGCRDLLRAAAIEQLPPPPPPKRGASPPPPSGAAVVESEDRIKQEARGAAILLILDDKVRKK